MIDDAEAGAQPHGTAVCPPGALSYPAGVLPFGPGHPVLCVNDQCGYLVEQPKIQAELLVGDFSSIIALARRGMDQGLYVFNVQLMEAHLLPEQRRLMPRIVAAVFQATGCCIAVDARDPGTVDLSLDAYPFKAMCNSVNGEPENLRAMLPVVARHGAAIGTALVYEGGVPKTVAERLLVARRIVHAAEAHGIPRQDVIIDAVCLPSAVAPGSMRVTLETIKALHEELEVPVLLGISNAGYMMPNPRMVDLACFLASVSWGLDVAMIDPSTPLLPWLSKAGDFLNGVDPVGKGYLDYYRKMRVAKPEGICMMPPSLSI